MVSDQRLKRDRERQRKKYGWKPQNDYSMRFPEIVETIANDVWGKLNETDKI